MGKFIIISDVEYTVEDFKPHYNRFKVKIGQEITRFAFHFKGKQLFIKYPDRDRKQVLPKNGHTMATLPIYLLYKSPKVIDINVMIEGDFQTFKVVSKMSGPYITFWSEGQEVAKIRRKDNVPMQIKSLPIKFMGIPLEGITATFIKAPPKK